VGLIGIHSQTGEVVGGRQAEATRIKQRYEFIRYAGPSPMASRPE
jgi:hypothetical protein